MPGPTNRQQRILEYLRANVDGDTYFKSWRMAQDLGLSSKEVGTNVSRIADRDTELTIEQWGYSSGTTWKVTRE